MKTGPSTVALDVTCRETAVYSVPLNRFRFFPLLTIFFSCTWCFKQEHRKIHARIHGRSRSLDYPLFVISESIVFCFVLFVPQNLIFFFFCKSTEKYRARIYTADRDRLLVIIYYYLCSRSEAPLDQSFCVSFRLFCPPTFFLFSFFSFFFFFFFFRTTTGVPSAGVWRPHLRDQAHVHHLAAHAADHPLPSAPHSVVQVRR